MTETTPPRPTPVLYLDIDGTVRQGKDDALGRFVNGPADVVVFPEAVEMMRRWKAGGGRLAQHHDDEYYPPHMGLMVGDRDEDVQCAKLAGLDFQDAAAWRMAADQQEEASDG
jgi:histidinol phosphatase-like enzyme